MSGELSVYIGPYLVLPKDFDWEDFESIVTEGRGEYGIDDEKLTLVPNRDLPGISREMTIERTGEQQFSQINPATIVRETAALSKLASPIFDYCDENDIEIMEAWGIVPRWY